MTAKQYHLVALQVRTRVNMYYISNVCTDVTVTLYPQQIIHDANVILQVSTTDHVRKQKYLSPSPTHLWWAF